MPDTLTLNSRLTEIASAFLRLGCTAFGGPVAHLGYLHDECVTTWSRLVKTEEKSCWQVLDALPLTMT